MHNQAQEIGELILSLPKYLEDQKGYYYLQIMSTPKGVWRAKYYSYKQRKERFSVGSDNNDLCSCLKLLKKVMEGDNNA